jgi:glycosyltransferase involved in cell wall biosynthesis
VIQLSENSGKAHAMMAGFKRAQELGFEIVVMLDGDGQHHPDEIPAVVAPVLAGTADMVIGSRFLEIEADIPKYRVAGQKVLNGFTNATCTFKTTDSQSGFRALGKRALANLTFSSEGYNIESDMITHFSECGFTLCEVPINVTYDVPHKHKKNPVIHGFEVLAKLIGMIGYRRPLLSFGVPGLFFFIVGFLAEIYTFSQYVRAGSFHYILFTAGIAFLTLGLLLMMCGLILNSLVIIMKEGLQARKDVK